MALKTYKPTSPGIRHRTGYSFEEITTNKPAKALTVALRKTAGRNNHGHVTVKCKGGGTKKRYRIIDFKREKTDIPGKIVSVEYDPNRTSYIALVSYRDGEKKYIIAPTGLKVDDIIVSGSAIEIESGNALKLRDIPPGQFIHNIELRKDRGAKLVRSAGTQAQLFAKEGNYAHVKLPSGEIRLIHQDCRATIGQVGNVEHRGISIGKAGRNRWKGKRPRTRARAMNPVDHPLGGGEGKSAGGRHPCSAWGQLAKGLKTRKKRKDSSYIIQRRVPKRLKKKGIVT